MVLSVVLAVLGVVAGLAALLFARSVFLSARDTERNCVRTRAIGVRLEEDRDTPDGLSYRRVYTYMDQHGGRHESCEELTPSKPRTDGPLPEFFFPPGDPGSLRVHPRKMYSVAAVVALFGVVFLVGGLSAAYDLWVA
ncbi:hypothetical protein [Corynebacterium sp. 335C]